ncbi:hypothetical protein K4L44_07285 [Halosquirtibacter laminarini]|uniref:Uncharacterized protein n=1 Tax=Halosquirtibacter laminarini TaxID=3374600 RepID=A0AC61NQC0_9BACT|nr:hypothetical protein K4L44_07285 [Prolixibacteraceae bacterium]
MKKSRGIIWAFLALSTLTGCSSFSKQNNKQYSIKEISQKVTTNIIQGEIPTKDLKFSYENIDLNGNGKPECFVGIPNGYYCGSGGCTFFLMDEKLDLKQQFSVSDVPFRVLKSSHDGWNDLVIMSNGRPHLMIYKNGHYPSNPSVEPIWKGNESVVKKTVFGNYYKGAKRYAL